VESASKEQILKLKVDFWRAKMRMSGDLVRQLKKSGSFLIVKRIWPLYE
jgi:hypothetical protein